MMKTTLINLAFCGVVALTNCFAGNGLQNHDTTSSDSDTQSPTLTENQIITNSSDSDKNRGDAAERLHAMRSERLRKTVAWRNAVIDNAKICRDAVAKHINRYGFISFEDLKYWVGNCRATMVTGENGLDYIITRNAKLYTRSFRCIDISNISMCYDENDEIEYIGRGIPLDVAKMIDIVGKMEYTSMSDRREKKLIRKEKN